MSDISDKVKAIVVEALSVEADQVTLSSNLVDDLGADSLARVELVMQIEEEFDIEISDSDSEKILTVQAIIDYVNQKKAA
ncbi:MAG: acyl carrier protein [Alphaproteobacteria bacterium CG_4_10_14_0_8_um_filter_37_21]|nr:MAG: acyl carrier protein [Alphaproteobacteria bacterium CG_4_10_14_0_8_um_filter_37_21]